MRTGTDDVLAQRDAIRWLTFVVPGILAAAYPFLLVRFHSCLAPGGTISILSLLWLALACAVPLIAIGSAQRLGRIPSPDAGQQRARKVAILAVAAPTIYVFIGVVLYMAGDPVPDTLPWLVFWLGATAYSVVGFGQRELLEPVAATSVSPPLRVAHGISAAIILLIFLGMHISSHLSALWSLPAQKYLLDLFRHVYRAGFVEPILIALMFFQIASGVAMLMKYSRQVSDLYRNLQLCTGAYLIFFISGHMNSVFIYARTFLKIPTDWNFATGAPTGLIADPWNIRLLPHYLLGVAFVLTHLVLGARVIVLTHFDDNRNLDTINRISVLFIAISFIVAISIIVGMAGVHFVTN